MDAAIILTTRYHRRIPDSTIRAWASKGHITRHRVRGRTLYDLAQLTAHADTIWEKIAG